MEKNLINIFKKTWAFMLRNGTASANRVALHIMVHKYWLPAFVFGKGAMQERIHPYEWAQTHLLGQ